MTDSIIIEDLKKNAYEEYNRAVAFSQRVEKEKQALDAEVKKFNDKQRAFNEDKKVFEEEKERFFSRNSNLSKNIERFNSEKRIFEEEKETHNKMINEKAIQMTHDREVMKAETKDYIKLMNEMSTLIPRFRSSFEDYRNERLKGTQSFVNSMPTFNKSERNSFLLSPSEAVYLESEEEGEVVVEESTFDHYWYRSLKSTPVSEQRRIVSEILMIDIEKGSNAGVRRAYHDYLEVTGNQEEALAVSLVYKSIWDK